MSNTDGEDTQRIEKIRLYGTYDQVLQSLHEAHDDIDKHKQIIRQRNTELASLHDQLKQKEEVIRELKSFIDKHASHYWNNETLKEYQSLTTKDK